jgi:glycosyltransferase involved in cell wall biosynthesis
MTEALVKRVRRDGARLIYTLDDNLLDLSSWRFGHQSLTPEQKMVVRFLTREADGVIVSTGALRDRFVRLNPRIAVVPNALDERLFGDGMPGLDGARNTARKVIGFMGTFSHDADLMMILQALRATLRRHPDTLELQLVGGVADAAVLQAFEGLPLRVMELDGQDEYPAFVRWLVSALRWDLAIAPLEDNPFTRCKSDIKFLDYSALGVAGIYSRVPAYEQTVRHLESGYLADNTPTAWAEALERMLMDDDLRQRLASNARDYVWSNRTLQQCAHQWQQALATFAN